MLFRVAGRIGPKDTDRFTSRLEAASVIGAISTARNSLNEAGVTDEKITEIRARQISGGSAIRFSKPGSKKQASRPAAATPAAATPAAGAAKK